MTDYDKLTQQIKDIRTTLDKDHLSPLEKDLDIACLRWLCSDYQNQFITDNDIKKEVARLVSKEITKPFKPTAEKWFYLHCKKVKAFHYTNRCSKCLNVKLNVKYGWVINKKLVTEMITIKNWDDVPFELKTKYKNKFQNWQNIKLCCGCFLELVKQAPKVELQNQINEINESLKDVNAYYYSWKSKRHINNKIWNKYNSKYVYANCNYCPKKNVMDIVMIKDVGACCQECFDEHFNKTFTKGDLVKPNKLSGDEKEFNKCLDFFLERGD